MAADLATIRIKVLGGKEAAAEEAAVAGGMKDVEAASTKASKASSKVSSGIGSMLKKSAPVLKSTGKSLSKYLTLPLVGAGIYAVHTAAEFQRSMAQVQVAGGVGGAGMKSLEHLALEMGAKTIFSANESAEAMLELVKSGISPAKVEAGALAATMSLAATEGLGLGRTAEIVGAAMNTFNIPASKSASIADALAGGANASSASVGGLSESLAQAGQSVAMYGGTLNEAVGGLAAFAQNGIQASDAGTSLKTFMMRLNPTQKKQRELMDELNLSFFNQRGEYVGLVETAKRLRGALGGLTQEQRGQYLQTLFGSDAQRAANIVFREGPKGIEKYIRATEKRGGAERMANAQMKGLPGAIERVKGSLETAALVAGQAMAPAVEWVAGKIEWAANAFSELNPHVQKLIVIGLGVLAVVGPLLVAIGYMIPAVMALATAVAFLFSPVTLIVLAVAALAAGLIYAYEKVEWFHDAVDAVFGFLKAHPWVGLLLGGIPALISAIVLVVQHFNWIKNAVRNVIHFFAVLPSRALAGVKALPGLIKRFIVKAIVFVALFPIRAPIYFVKFGAKMVSILLGLLPQLAGIGAHMAAWIAKGLASGAVALWGWIKTLPGKFGSAVSAIAGQLRSIGSSIAHEIASGLADTLTSILPGPVKDALAGAAGVAGEVGDFVTGGFASGTPSAPGGLALVGEQGPELVNLPRGSEVTPRRRTMDLLSGEGKTARGSDRLRRMMERTGRTRAARIEVPVYLSRRKIAEAVAEQKDDDEARL